MKRTDIPLAVLAFCLAGCSTMAPKYEQPKPPVPANWPAGEAYKTESSVPAQKPLTDIPWQEFFIDPQLRKLIALALENNRDLRVATLNIEKFQAQYQIQRSDLFPKVDASAEADYQRIAENFSGTGLPMSLHQYRVGLGVSSYELDLFGRVRSLKDQALEQYLATGHARRAVQLSLISQVATGWLTLASDRERLQLAKDTLVNQQQSYNLVKNRYDAGIASALALNQARTSVDAARVDIARYTALVAQDENGLRLLAGAPLAPELLPRNLPATVTLLENITPGLPSEVLLLRPDILESEGQLKAANANIGAAQAALFPRITLVASTGFGSDELGSLFQSGAYVYKFAPQITLPIFDGGSNEANLAVARVNRDIALAQYEKSIQTAFREVADALAQRGTIDEQLSAQQSLAAATEASYRLSAVRYEKGVDSYLTLLDSQRSLYAAQQNLISTRLTQLSNLVTLYKVLGGNGKDQSKIKGNP